MISCFQIRIVFEKPYHLFAGIIWEAWGSFGIRSYLGMCGIHSWVGLAAPARFTARFSCSAQRWHVDQEPLLPWILQSDASWTQFSTEWRFLGHPRPLFFENNVVPYNIIHAINQQWFLWHSFPGWGADGMHCPVGSEQWSINFYRGQPTSLGPLLIKCWQIS